MIRSRQVFEYQGKPLIEKVEIEIPYRYEAVFPNEGCFLYVIGAQTTILSSDSKTVANPKDGVLLKCGSYFVDWMKQTKSDVVQVIAFHLDKGVLRQLYQQKLPLLAKNSIQDHQVTVLTNDSIIEKFIENLLFYFDNPQLINEDLLELKIKELILLLLQTKETASVLELLSDLFSSRSINIKEVIETHILSGLPVGQLAQLCGMSVSTFKREFEKIYARSPNNYLLSARIDKACELLKSSSQGISEIAFSTGFNDPAYFARLFKKRLKMSPSDYRATAKMSSHLD